MYRNGRKTACAGRRNKCQPPVREKTRRVLSPVRLSRHSSRHRAEELAGGCRGGQRSAARWSKRNGALGFLFESRKRERDEREGFSYKPDACYSFHRRLSPPLNFRKFDKMPPSPSSNKYNTTNGIKPEPDKTDNP